jgi:quercetin dioxygenase-like cupin family protein
LFFTPHKGKALEMEELKDSKEMPKSIAHIIVEILEYIPNAVVVKTIIRKSTGNITVSSVSEGEELGDKISAFDIYVQIIDGEAAVSINDKIYQLKLGEGIIIPANSRHCFNANQQFKMLSTIIKSGYED